MQSYEFDFSVENEKLAERLMLEGGKVVELRYKEYFGALPWRGFTKYIVDSIITHDVPALPEASVLDDSSSVIKEQVQLAELFCCDSVPPTAHPLKTSGGCTF